MKSFPLEAKKNGNEDIHELAVSNYICVYALYRNTCSYYPPRDIFDPYRGIYGAGYILFLYNGASVPWIMSVNNFWFLNNILESM